jgi:lipopolysaccharide biosynthesis regulator YciM
MNSVPRHLLALCLLALCLHPLHAQSRNPYDLELQQLASYWDAKSLLERLIALDGAWCLRDYVGNRAQVRLWLESIARSSNEDGLVRDEAQAYLDDLGALEGIGRERRTQHWYELRAARRRQVLDEAAQAATEGSGEGLQLLAELELLAGVPAAAEHMQQAARLAPSANRWARVAVLAGDQFQKFAALEAGLALDTNHRRLNLELASYYIGRRQPEKARDLLQRAAAAAPDDFVVRARLAELCLDLGLRSTALAELRNLEKQWPGPLWLRARLALDYEQAGLWDDAARLAASVVADEGANRDQLELLARIHQRRHMSRELEADYLALCRIQPESSELLSRLAQAQMDSGHFPAARDSLVRLLNIETDHDRSMAAHLRLAEVYQRLSLDREARQQRAAAEARTATPANPDSAFLSDARSLAKDAFLHRPEMADVALADVRVQELYSTGLSRLHVQQIFFVGSEAAADSHTIGSIRYSPASEELRVLHARVWKPGGQILQARELGEKDFVDGVSSMHYDLRVRQLRFPGLETGDVVELEYSLTPLPRRSPYGGYFGELVLFAGQQTAALKRYIFIAPRERTIYAHAEKVAPASITQSGESRIFLWEVHSVPPAPRDPRSPGLTETAPYVHVSTVSDWARLGEWYANLVRPQFALDQPLKEQVGQLINRARTDRDKIAAIQEFVLRSTRYVALEFGIYGYKPYPVAQTFARRFGDCKDKASLMIAMLREAGIDAELALVRTRSLGAVAEQPASIAVFDHAIVYVPKFDLWLDGTAEYGTRELPAEDQGALALTVNLNGAAQLRRVPVSRPADNYTRRIIHADLTPQGAIHFSGSTLTRGQDAPELRHELAAHGQQLDLFRRDLAEVYPTIQVDNVAVHGVDALDGDVSVDFQGALNSFQHRRAVLLRSSWMRRSYLSDLAPAAARTQDLLLPSPWTTEEEIHISLPARAEVRELPGDQSITTAFGSMRLHYSKSGREVLVQSRVEFEPTRVSAGDYPAFRQFCSQVDHSFRNEIKVGLPQ